MYAIIELQGFQYMVSENERIDVNRITGAEKKKQIKVDTVLFAGDGSDHHIGSPYIDNAYVECEVLGNKRARKVNVFKYRSRKKSQRLQGHRQNLTELRVSRIAVEKAGPSAKEEQNKKTSAPKASEASSKQENGSK